MPKPESIVDTDEQLTLWTLQNADVWERAEERGVLRSDGRHTFNFVRPGYRWLMDRMVERIEGYSGKPYPIWAYKFPKPDLRKKCSLVSGEPKVRVEFTADPSEVLLSHPQAFVNVIAGIHLSFDEAEANDFDPNKEIWSVWEDTDLDPTVEASIRQSWLRVFDLDECRKHPEWLGEYEEQATLKEVQLDSVTDVTHYISR